MPKRINCVFVLVVFALAALPLQTLRSQATGKPWIDMDYGPFFTASLQVTEGNIACKGIAIRLDEGEGGVSFGEEFMLFNTDTLSFVAGWTGGGFINWKNIALDGSHGTHASLVGELVFSNPSAPGWGQPGTGSFEDERIRGRDGLAYGPVAREWAHWKGLYLKGDQVVLSYTVGDTKVLELPGAERSESAHALTRTINLGPRSKDLILQVANVPEEEVKLRDIAVRESSVRQMALLGVAEEPKPRSPQEKQVGAVEFDGTTSLEVAGLNDFDFRDQDFSITARIKTEEGGTILAKAPREGGWARDGTTFFVRDERLCYDIGWVGVVVSEREVADGDWHQVAMTYQHADGRVRLFVDGRLDKEGRLKPESKPGSHVVRVGFTSPNFPEDRSCFLGEMRDVRVYRRALSPEEVAALGRSPESEEMLVARWELSATEEGDIADTSGNGHTARPARVAELKRPSLDHSPVAVAILGELQGIAWLPSEEGHLRLRIPAGGEPARLKLLYSRLNESTTLESFAKLVQNTSVPMDLEPLTRGGPPRWREKLVTRGKLGQERGPFAIDDITTPFKNPWNAWMRFGGFDFFADGKRAAIGTWNGDVWIVSGIDEKLEEVTWQRIATGLFQPLGLKIVDERVYVLGRDQITLLHDLNGDGEADFYENFNNDAQATPHFHEFAMDLQTDDNGDFYYMKAGRHALDAVVPQHGTVLKVTKDGKKTEIIAYGFRAPDGLCVNGDGTFLTTDQEGHWTPANRINWIKPGGFYGYMWAYHRGERPTDFEKPLCWMHPSCDRSPAEPIWVESKQWGALNGKLLNISYGMGYVYHVLYEHVGDQVQGGVVRLPTDIFATGIQRGRFHKTDGQLYLCGMFGWSSNRTLPGGFYRLRRTSQPLHLPLELRASRSGVLLSFAEPLDKRRSADPRRFSIERWNYDWHEPYGSKDFRLSDGKVGRDKVEIKNVKISKDAKTVFLEIPDMKPCMQMLIKYRLTGADKTRISQEIFSTVNVVNPDESEVEKIDWE